MKLHVSSGLFPANGVRSDATSGSLHENTFLFMTEISSPILYQCFVKTICEENVIDMLQKFNTKKESKQTIRYPLGLNQHNKIKLG